MGTMAAIAFVAAAFCVVYALMLMGTAPPRRNAAKPAAKVVAAASPRQGTASQPTPAAPPASTKPDGEARRLLDSLGAYRGAALVREYVPEQGGLGRLYAIGLRPDQGAARVTEFYERKLLARRFKVVQRHAALSTYSNGSRRLEILRAGPDEPQLPPRAREITYVQPPRPARFYFSVESYPDIQAKPPR